MRLLWEHLCDIWNNFSFQKICQISRPNLVNRFLDIMSNHSFFQKAIDKSETDTVSVLRELHIREFAESYLTRTNLDSVRPGRPISANRPLLIAPIASRLEFLVFFKRVVVKCKMNLHSGRAVTISRWLFISLS